MPNHYGTPGIAAGSQIDPNVDEAIHRLNQTELSPLEEAMFQSWSGANDVQDYGGPHNGMDFRGIYKQTGGKMFPPGILKQHADREEAIQTMMKAREAHAAADPMAALRAKLGGAPGGGFTPPVFDGGGGAVGASTGNIAGGILGGGYSSGTPAGGLGAAGGAASWMAAAPGAVGMSIDPAQPEVPPTAAPMAGAGGMSAGVGMGRSAGPMKKYPSGMRGPGGGIAGGGYTL